MKAISDFISHKFWNYIKNNNKIKLKFLKFLSLNWKTFWALNLSMSSSYLVSDKLYYFANEDITQKFFSL